MSYKRIDKSLEDINTKSIGNQEYKNKDNAFTRERKHDTSKRNKYTTNLRNNM